MDAARWKRVRELTERLLEAGEDERRAELVVLEAEDPALRRDVEELLRQDAEAGTLQLDRTGLGFHGEVDDLPAEREGDLIGSYRLVRPLGQGGMGSVWLAQRAEGDFEHQVAIKVVKRGMDSELILARFRRERQVLARLQHPNIVRLLDGGLTADGRPYLVMGYVDGKPIDVFCDERKSSASEVARLLVTVCHAVQAAHELSTVHRDLKPGNILVTADGTPRLLDFGIAKLVEGENDSTLLTQTGQRVLTPMYASPEQVRGGRVSAATDVYALGVLLYRLLTGRVPHDVRNSSYAELERAICREEPTRPSLAAPRGLRAELRGDLDVIVLRALAKEPARRYSNAGELADDLQRHLDGLPITARPDTVTYRVAKYVRRNRIQVAAALAVIAALTAGLISTTVQFRKARAAQSAAEQETLRANQQERIAREESIRAAEQEALAKEQAALAREEARVRRINEYTARLAAADAMASASQASRAVYEVARAEPELRGWEHAYLSRSLDRSMLRYTSPDIPGSGRVQSLAFSPDHRWLAYGSGSFSRCRTVRVLDAEGGEEVTSLLHGDLNLRALGFSRDGALLACGGSAGNLKVWSTADWSLVFERQIHGGRILQLQFGRSGDRLFTLGDDGGPDSLSVRRTSDFVETLRVPSPTGLTAIDDHPTEALVAMGTYDGSIRFQPLAQGAPAETVVGPPSPVESVRFHGSGRRLIALTRRGIVLHLDPTTPAIVERIDPPEPGNSGRASLSLDGERAVIPVAGRRYLVLDTFTGETVGTLVGGREEPYSTAFSADGSRVAAGNRYNLGVWDIEGTPSRRRLRLPADPQRLDVSADGTWIACGLADGRLCLIDGITAMLVRELGGHSTSVRDVSFHPRRPVLASVAAGVGILHDVERGVEIARFQSDQPLGAVEFCPDGTLLASADASGRVELRDPHTGELRQTLTGHESPVRALSFAPDGRRLASAGGSSDRHAPGDTAVHLWSIPDGEPLHRLTGHPVFLCDVIWSDDGTRVIATGQSFGPEVRMWDSATGVEVAARRPLGRAWATADLARMPGQGRLLVPAMDETVRVWLQDDLQTAVFTLQGGGSYGVAADPRGRYVAGIHRSRTMPRLDVWTSVEPTEIAYTSTLQRLLERHVLHSEVRARVAGDPWLPEDQRARALAILDVLPEQTASALLEEAMRPLVVPFRPRTDAHRSLRLARAAEELDAESTEVFFTQALACYRLGRHEECLLLLDEVESLREPEPGFEDGRPEDRLLRALALHAGGDEDLGRELFEQVERDLAGRTDDPPTRALGSLHREARERFSR